jgi:hypothetical protein
MGEPMDRSQRLFVKFDSSFEETFPTLENAVIAFTEFDFMVKRRSGKWHFAEQGGLMACANPGCRRGGYEFDFLIGDMTRARQTEKEFKLYCHGDEGSPKGRKVGRRCQCHIDAKITLKYKVQPANDPNGEPS